MRRPLTLPLLLLASALAAPAFAAPVILNASEAGWSALAAATYPTDYTRAAETINGRIRLEGVPAGNRVYAVNLQSNLATIGAAADLVRTTIGREGATHLLNVTVNVTEAPGAGARAYTREASVELKDGDRTQSLITSDGTAKFQWAKLGEATITVRSRGDDNKVRTATQKVNLDRDGLSGFVVPVTDLPAPAAGAGNGGQGTGNGAAVPMAGAPATAPSTGSTILGNLFSLVIGLAVVGGLAFAAWRYARANPERVSEALGKIGADVPKPLDPDDPPPATPATTPAPASVPSGPIILDPTPTPISVPQTPISLGAAATVATGIPKLIGADGSAFELPEGETVVGREALGGLMITHDTVSRRHARLVRSGGSVSVEDLGSTNGTWVNDAPAPASVYGGESVRFGQVAYRYEA